MRKKTLLSLCGVLVATIWILWPTRPKAPPPAFSTVADPTSAGTTNAPRDTHVARAQSVGGHSSSPDAGSRSLQETAKRCTDDRDCAVGLMCIRPRGVSSSSRPGRCRPGDCRTDGDCGPDASCLMVDGVSRCVEEGEQRENGACDLRSSERTRRCASGLLCVDSVCLRRCVARQESSCPDGRKCLSDGNGTFCAQRCDPSACKSGERCVTVGARSSCAIQVGESCEHAGCAGSEMCVTIRDPDTVFFECVSACDPDEPCAPGFVCAAPGGERGNTCLHSCRQDSECGPAGRCALVGNERGCLRYDPRR